ncbi:hypothetical protein DH2020_031262 [Rehmannia glutinosa]|uniref:Receptor-like serine/threonine-protein kinase n=1 Tax=Rehmannia glutinosa TaxID=99300 RepID=A0ABR0VIH1_REHGL
MSSHYFRAELLLQIMLLLINSFIINHALFLDYPSANVTSSWLNSPSTVEGNWRFSDNTSVRTILAVGRNGFPDFCFGFFNNGTADSFFLVIMKVPNKVDSTFSVYDYPPLVLWSANGNSPVGENAALAFTDAELALKDVDGTVVWSRSTPGSVGMELAFNGNLMLMSEQNGTIWESFQEPTNIWLPGQSLLPSQNLYSSMSTYNLAKGLFYLGMNNDFIGCYVDSRPAQQYCSLLNVRHHTSFDFGVGSLNRSGNSVTYIARSQDFQYLRLQPNGSLIVFLFLDNYKEMFYYDVLNDQLRDACSYPTVCGRYGVCNNTKCSCPDEATGRTGFFRQSNALQSDFGCEAINPISCGDSIDNHGFLELLNVNYFSFRSRISSIDAPQCKDICLRCSCRAVVFRYRDYDTSKGECSFPTDLFSLMVTKKDNMLPYKANTYVKIQIPRANNKKSSSTSLVVLLVSLFSSGIFLLLLGACYFYVLRRKKRSIVNEREGETSIIHVPPVVIKFSYNDLRAIAENFRVQLGKGGYGEVFEGTLKDGTKVAVKQLFDKGKTEFLPEVETIGRVHHFNLVRLIGYCAEGSNRLLVYEYLHKGSLDKWIFDRNGEQNLTWKIKWQIILGIAKGLEYLHEHCNPKIIHFDIKPQNILLDEEFNVKIADFGLAKWIERDQSKISTMIKGTRGYMAPELIAGRNVSVKVDVYSFGIVILEIVCGRKNSDMYENEVYLIDEVKRKAEEGRLEDVIDECDEELRGDKGLAVKAVEIAIRCLQIRAILGLLCPLL